MINRLKYYLIAVGLFGIAMAVLGFNIQHSQHKLNHVLMCKGNGFQSEHADVDMIEYSPGFFVLQHKEGVVYLNVGTSVCAYVKKD